MINVHVTDNYKNPYMYFINTVPGISKTYIGEDTFARYIISKSGDCDRYYMTSMIEDHTTKL